MAWFAHLHQVGFQPSQKIWESIYGGNGVSGTPYAHPHPEKTLKHLIYVCHGHGMQFEWFLQPQSKCSGMVCTLASGRMSAYFPKFGESSVVIKVGDKGVSVKP